MPDYFTPPNPYGSYFAFDSASMMLPSNYAPDTRMSAGMATMMGQQTSFNPSAVELANQTMRNMHYQRYMSDMIRTDRRVEGLSNIAQRLMFGDNAELRARGVASFGGINTFNQGIGSALNMSPLGTMLGGNYGSLAAGALQAITSGNLNYGGMSVNGDGLMQVNMARTLMNRLKGQFTNLSTGLPNLAATSGLNIDQLGGILGVASAQGAFSGLNIAGLNDKGKMVPDDTTLNKMTDFTKKAAKAVGVLMDVFGPGPLADQLNRMQQITGLDLSRLDNPQGMTNKLNSLRMAADRLGVMPQQMMNMAAESNAFMASRGMNLGIGDLIAVQSASAYNSQRAQQSSMVTNPMSQNQMLTLGTVNAMGMVMDPMGAVVNATAVMGQRRGLRGAALSSLVDRVTAVGGESGLGGMYNFFQNEFGGLNAPGFISSQGGAVGMFKQILPENQAIVLAASNRDLHKRGFVGLQYEMSKAGIGSPEAMGRLLEGLGAGTLDAAARLYERGTSDKVILDVIKANIDPAQNPQTYLDDLKSMAQGDVVDQVGTALNIKNSNPILANYQRPFDQARQMLTPSAVDLSGVRGSMTQNKFMMGVLGGITSGRGFNVYSYMRGNMADRVASDIDLNSTDSIKLQHSFKELLKISSTPGNEESLQTLTNMGITSESIKDLGNVDALGLKLRNPLYAEMIKSRYNLFRNKEDKTGAHYAVTVRDATDLDPIMKKIAIMGVGLSTMKAAGVSEDDPIYKNLVRGQKRAIAASKNIELDETQKGVMERSLQDYLASTSIVQLTHDRFKGLRETDPLAAETILQGLQKNLSEGNFKDEKSRIKAEQMRDFAESLGVGAGEGSQIINGTLKFDPASTGLLLKGVLGKTKEGK